MQPQFLKMYAPNSLHLLYRPLDTGNPGFDMGQHIALNSHHRIDLESTQLIGNRVIGHIEHALGPADEAEQQYRILTVPYAEKQLGSTMDAAELIRVIKEAVSAGVEADPRSLQIWASWAYNECKTRPVSEVLKELAMMAMQMTAITTTKENQLEDEPEVFEFHGPVHCFTDSDPTANKEDRQREQRRLFEQRCDEILDQHETTAPFAAELRPITAKLPRHHSITNLRDEEAQFQEYLAGLVDQGDCNAEALQESHERVTEQYDEGGVVSLHMSESERFIVDGTLDDDVDQEYLPFEAKDLVPELRDLFANGTPLSTSRDDEYSINDFIENQLDRLYGDRTDDQTRTIRNTQSVIHLSPELLSLIPALERILTTTVGSKPDFNSARRYINSEVRSRMASQPTDRQRTSEEAKLDLRVYRHLREDVRLLGLQSFPEEARALILRARQIQTINNACATLTRLLPAISRGTFTVYRTGLVEFQETTETYTNREERQYVREVLDQIIENMKRDFILNTMNRSATFRRFMLQIENATDPRDLKLAIQEAFKARTAKTLNIKMFTALTTIYRVKLARLDSTPVRTQDTDGTTYVNAASVINLSRKTKDVHQLAVELHTLPAIEREPVRTAFQQTRTVLYDRMKARCYEEIRNASPRKLMYLRYALFEDPKTGNSNQPDNIIHLLCRQDRTAIWKELQEATRLSRPAAA